MSHGADSLKSIIFALSANLMIAFAKLGAALFTKSGSMLAEAIHSFADSANQILLIIGLRQAKRVPCEDYPLGHGRAIYFWSFIVAILLFSMGGVFSIYEGIHKISLREEMHYPWLAVGIIFFSMVMESISLWGCMREVNKVRGGRSLWKWFRETRQSELFVVMGEDIAALLGLTMALISILLSIFTGNVVFDAIGSIAIGVLLVIVAFIIGNEVKDLLIGQSVDEAERNAITDFVKNYPTVLNVLNIITLQLGNDVMVAVKALMKETSGNMELMQNINECECAIKKEFPQVKWIFFEPDFKD